jgi:hypothetical protein
MSDYDVDWRGNPKCQCITCKDQPYVFGPGDVEDDCGDLLMVRCPRTTEQYHLYLKRVVEADCSVVIQL